MFKKKSSILRDHCKEVGTDFDSITRSVNFDVLCAPTEAEVAEKKKWYRSHMETYVSERGADRFVRMYERSSGTPEQIIEKMRALEEAGMGYAIVNFADVAYDRSSLELFAKEVIPAFS